MKWEKLHEGGDPEQVLNVIEPQLIKDHGTLHPRGLNMAAGGGNWKRRTRRRKRYKTLNALIKAPLRKKKP